MQTQACRFEAERKMSSSPAALLWFGKQPLLSAEAPLNEMCTVAKGTHRFKGTTAFHWLKRAKNWWAFTSLPSACGIPSPTSFLISPFAFSHFSPSLGLWIKGGTTKLLHFWITGNLAPNKSMVTHKLYSISLNSTLVWNRLNRHGPTAAAG